MLTLEQYGVKLVRLQQGDIELVRYWRNQSDIANYMEYRNYITEDAQKEWFKKVNNKYNYYFIIEFEGKQVGLINAKNYDPLTGFGEGGIFIWDKDYINSFAAPFSSLCLLNFMLLKVSFSGRSRIRILRNNERAIQYNKLLGYKLLPGQEEVENQLYELDITDYNMHGHKLNKVAAILADGDSELRYSGTVCEENMDEINRLLAGKIV
jgi:UDP-4-amino-4,6-dideoxy-N-acetyl-beta-L-altrosamine N-acetyltransferase